MPTEQENFMAQALALAAEALLRAVKGAEGRPNKELKKWTERIEALTRDIMN